MVWYRALKFVTHLEYEYAQVALDLFCENITLIHCSVVVCNYFSPFFLYFKECVIISKFGSTVLCSLTRETRITRHKPIAWHTKLLDCMNVPPLTMTLSTISPIAVKMKFSMGEYVVVRLSKEQLDYSTKYIIHLNRGLKTS